MPGIIYILTNEAMPSYIKIGKTTDLPNRVKDLSRATGVPLPFEVFYAAEVQNVNFAEHQIHEAFGRTRVAPNREFFTETPERIVAILKLIQIREVTPREDLVEEEGDRQALAKIKRFKKRFDFVRYEIPVGSILTFTRDNTVTCTVFDDGNVKFNGEIISLSKAAQKALNVSYPVQGPIFWQYNEKTLDEKRREIDLMDTI